MSSVNNSGGIPSIALYKQIAQETEATAVAKYVKQTPEIKTQEKQFDSAVKQLGKDPNALFKNYNLLNFVLTAFGATDQISNVGLLKKVVNSDVNNSKSLVNQLNNGTLKQLTQVLQTDGSVNASLNDPKIQAEIKNAFEVASYEGDLSQQHPAVVQALDFSHLIGGATSIYDIMGNATLRAVVSVVGNIPQTVVNQDLTTQAQVFSKAIDVSKVSDPNYVQKYINRFLGLSDAKAAASSSASSNPALSVLSSLASGGSSSVVSLDLGSVVNFKA